MRFKVRSYPLGFLSGAAQPEQLAAIINEAAHGGYRFKREEVNIEPRRVLFLMRALALNIVFKWEQDEPGYEYRICIYRTRPLTRTVDVSKLTATLNEAVRGGFEVYFGFKHLTRWLMVLPRETYFFVLRRRIDGANQERSYRFVEYGYRFFSQTMDPAEYEQVLNLQGGDSRHVVSFRDERRILGAFRQIVALTLFEDAAGAVPQFLQQPVHQLPQQHAQHAYPAAPALPQSSYPPPQSSYPPPAHPQTAYPQPEQQYPQQAYPQQNPQAGSQGWGGNWPVV
jgi:hypothetical protein